MADTKNVQVPLPPGMSQEEFLKLFSTFQKARIQGKARDTATRAAVKALISNHQSEYDTLYADEYAKAGGS